MTSGRFEIIVETVPRSLEGGRTWRGYRIHYRPAWSRGRYRALTIETNERPPRALLASIVEKVLELEAGE